MSRCARGRKKKKKIRNIEHAGADTDLCVLQNPVSVRRDAVELNSESEVVMACPTDKTVVCMRVGSRRVSRLICYVFKSRMQGGKCLTKDGGTCVLYCSDGKASGGRAMAKISRSRRQMQRAA